MNIRHKLVSISIFAFFCAQAATAKDVTIGEMKFGLSEEEGTAIVVDAKNVDTDTVKIPETIPYENHNYTVTGIGDRAFYKNAYIKEVILPKSINSLGAYSFGSCNQLKGINIPSNVQTLEEGVFYACQNIESIQFEKREQAIPIKDYTFYKCEKLPTIQFCLISDTVGAFAFANCTLLSGCMDLSSVNFVGEKAFYKCTSIDKFIIGEHSDFGSYAFYDCIKIKELKITNPNNFGDHCFSNCEALDSVVIEYTEPYQLGGFADSCFSRCKSLNAIKILDYSRYIDTVYHPELSSGICGIGTNVFDHTPLQQGIYVSEDEIEEYKNAEDWKDYAGYLVAIKIHNPYFKDTTSDTIPETNVDSIPKVIEDTISSGSDDTLSEAIVDTTTGAIVDTTPSIVSLENLRIIVFGDSKAEGVGNQGPNKEYRPWGYYLQEEYGCTVTNVAVGGTHLTPASLKPQNNQNGLGTYSLVQAWKSGDYSLVDASLEWAHNSKYGTRWDHVVETIKNTTAQDYDIVCIEAGTNDWNNRLRVIGSWEDTYPIYNYTVALRNIIESLYEMNPNLYILVIPPVVRQMDVNDKSTYSDYYLNPNSELYLYDVSMGMMEIAKKCNADAIDAYYGMGFDINNWYPENSGDGTHPNENGYKVMAEKIGEHILKNYFKSSNPESIPEEPTEEPTIEPTEEPTIEPTEGPTIEPTEEPTIEPTEEPDPTSAIDIVNGDMDSTQKSVYDFHGRKLQNTSEDLLDGFYIINGKKCFIKKSLK